MITPEGIITFPAIFEPKENLSGVLKYSCSILFDKADKKGIDLIKAAIAKATLKGKGTVWGGKLPKFRYQPLRDGDEELASGEKTGKEYEGRVFLNCSSDNPPGVVDRYARPLMDERQLYSGCIVRLDINAFPYKNGGNSGVGWGLNNVMVVADGDRLDGRQNAEDAFSSFAQVDSAETPEDNPF